MLIFAFIFFLSNLNMQLYIAALEAVLGLFIIYNIFAYINYEKTINLKDTITELKGEKNNIIEEYNNYRSNTKEYFMMLVHQMKTPITASKLIVEDMPYTNDELKKQLLYMDDYVNMSIAFLKLIDTNSDMDIAKTNLDKIIKEVLKKYSILFISKNIKLDYKLTDAYVISDARWLSILIEQIISNALKYTKKGYIKIYFDEESLYIKDTGIGIKKEDINKIFDMGYSGLNGRANEKSSGLGLYLAKKISYKLNIEIDIDSKLGKGSTFILKFKTNTLSLL